MQSDRGTVRDRNEDAWLTFQLALSHQAQPPAWMGLFAVADGLGGHSEGASASQMAIRSLAREVFNRLVPALIQPTDSSERADPIHDVLSGGFRSAHWRLRREMPHAASTLTSALTLGTGIYVAHVGDTRLYCGCGTTLRRATQDHSMAERLLSLGHLGSEAAPLQRHRLYRALGQDVDLEPDLDFLDAREQQYLLLCSDGLWGQIGEEDIGSIIQGASSPQAACDELVRRANQVGGEDNATVILIARGWPPDKA